MVGCERKPLFSRPKEGRASASWRWAGGNPFRRNILVAPAGSAGPFRLPEQAAIPAIPVLQPCLKARRDGLRNPSAGYADPRRRIWRKKDWRRPLPGRSSSFAAAVNSSRFRRRGVAFLSEIYPCSFRFLLEKGPIRHILYRQRILSEADGRLLWIKRESDPSYMENGASRSPASRGGRPARPGGPGAGFPVKSSELTDKRGCRPWKKMV